MHASARCHSQVARSFTRGLGATRPLREIVLAEFPSLASEWLAVLQEVEKDDWQGFTVTPEPGRALRDVFADPLLDSFAGTPLPTFATDDLVRACGRAANAIHVTPALVEKIGAITLPILPRAGLDNVRDGTSYLVIATTHHGSRDIWFHEPGENVLPSVVDLIHSLKAARRQ
jgi:hypothetical protein